MRERRGLGPWDWLLLIFELLVFFSNGGFFTDGTNIISPAAAERLDMDQSIILTMNSVAGIIDIPIAVAAGQANQRISPSKVAAGCLILAGLSHTVVCNAVNVPMYLVVIRFMGGGLSSGSFVSVGTLVAMWFPKRQRQAMSIVAMGPSLEAMLSAPLFNVLAGSIGMSTDSVICGSMAIVVGVISMVSLHDTPRERSPYPDNVIEVESKVSYSSASPELDNSGWTTGKLLRTKEAWLCALPTGFLVLVQMGIMAQLAARSTEVGIAPDPAISVMSVIAVIRIIDAVVFGRILFRLDIRKAGALTSVPYIMAMFFNISDVMPLVWVSLAVIGFLGVAAPALMNSVPDSVFDRVGYAKVNSVVLPLANIIFMYNLAVNGLVRKLLNNLSVAYIIFAGLAFLSILLILAPQDHKYDQDYMAAYK